RTHPLLPHSSPAPPPEPGALGGGAPMFRACPRTKGRRHVVRPSPRPLSQPWERGEPRSTEHGIRDTQYAIRETHDVWRMTFPLSQLWERESGVRATPT